MTLANEIIYGTVEGVKEILREGADVNEIDEYGFTPLIEAAIVNNVEMAEVLIEHHATVNQDDVTGHTALHWAVDNNNMALSKLLLNNKANPNAYTIGGQSVLVYPLLREQQAIKKLLYHYGADLNFAQDFINAKLLGHRYELLGQVDIVDNENRFIELNYEGFFLEFTLEIIRHSLERYKNNFAARRLRPYFNYLSIIIDRFANASRLLKYQNYLINVRDYANEVNALLSGDILFLPIAYEGHAISFIKFGDLLAKCDRGANSQIEGSVVIYRIGNPRAFDAEFIKNFLYQKQSEEFVHHGINQMLQLTTIMQLPLPSQLIGNCSWANVEATIPTLLFLLMFSKKRRTSKKDITELQRAALLFYRQWMAWDKDRALEECIKSFHDASRTRKASKATMLGAILFQKCNYLNPKDVEKAEKILAILALPEYQYILKSYLQIYWKNRKTPAGNNLVHLLDFCGVNIE